MNTDWRGRAGEILLKGRYLDLAILWEPVLPMCRQVVGTYRTLSIRIADGELNDCVDASIWATIRVAIDGISRISGMVALVGIDDFLGTFGKEAIAFFTERPLPDEDIRLLHNAIGLEDYEIERLMQALREDGGKTLDQRGDRTVSEFR